MARVQTLAIRLLADLGHADVDGVEPGALGSRKGRSLLWLLALGRGRPVAVDHLVEALWGDAAPERPGDQVAVLVSRLRAVVGRDRIEHGDGGYRLHVPGDGVLVASTDRPLPDVTALVAQANAGGEPLAWIAERLRAEDGRVDVRVAP